jgi:hypothetical protein
MKLTNPDRDSRKYSHPQVDCDKPKLTAFKDQLPAQNKKIQSSVEREFPQHTAFL